MNKKARETQRMTTGRRQQIEHGIEEVKVLPLAPAGG
jgi:hypothetical protein